MTDPGNGAGTTTSRATLADLVDYGTERAFLGGMLVPAREIRQEVFDRYSARILELDEHRSIYAKMEWLFRKTGDFELPTLFPALPPLAQHALIDVEKEGIFTSSSVLLQTERLADLAHRRRLYHQGTRLQQGALGTGDPADLQCRVMETLQGDTSATSARPRFNVRSLADLAQTEPAPWLVRDFIRQGTVGTLYGAPDSLKSFLALDIALHVAGGLEWHGNAAHGGAVLYVAGEGQSGYGIRVRAWGKGHPKPWGDDEHAIYANFRQVDPAPQLLDVSDVAAFLSAISHIPDLVLIIIDTLSMAMPGSDELTADMSQAVAAARMVSRETGATVMFVHHTTKDGKAERGGVALRGNGDFMFLAVADSQGQQVKLTCNKQKDGARAPIMGFEKVVEPLGEDRNGDPISSCWLSQIPSHAPPLVSVGLRQNVSLVFDVVSRRDLFGPLRKADMVKACETEIELSRATVYRAIEELTAKGYVEEYEQDGETFLRVVHKEDESL